MTVLEVSSSACFDYVGRTGRPNGRVEISKQVSGFSWRVSLNGVREGRQEGLTHPFLFISIT